MLFNKTIKLKDGRECILRNGTAEDGKDLLEVFNLTHEQTDYLLTYPDENTYSELVFHFAVLIVLLGVS